MIRGERFLGFFLLLLTACSGRPAPDDLTSPLDFQLAVGDELQMEMKENEDGQVSSGILSLKLLEPGPLPGTGEVVARTEEGLTRDHPKWGRGLIHGVGFHRINEQVEESLGFLVAEVDGRPKNDLKIYELPYLDLKAPLVLGARWEFRHIRTADHPQWVPTPYRYTKRLQATGLTLELPAGRFERCIRFEVEGHSEVPVPVTCGQRQVERQVLKKTIVYYCPRVGNVRELTVTRHGDPGRPDPTCPTKRSEYTATRLIRAPTASTQKM